MIDNDGFSGADILTGKFQVIQSTVQVFGIKVPAA